VLVNTNPCFVNIPPGLAAGTTVAVMLFEGVDSVEFVPQDTAIVHPPQGMTRIATRSRASVVVYVMGDFDGAYPAETAYLIGDLDPA
jgi:hypothetical protein